MMPMNHNNHQKDRVTLKGATVSQIAITNNYKRRIIPGTGKHGQLPGDSEVMDFGRELYNYHVSKPT